MGKPRTRRRITQREIVFLLLLWLLYHYHHHHYSWLRENSRTKHCVERRLAVGGDGGGERGICVRRRISTGGKNSVRKSYARAARKKIKYDVRNVKSTRFSSGSYQYRYGKTVKSRVDDDSSHFGEGPDDVVGKASGVNKTKHPFPGPGAAPSKYLTHI